MQSCSSVAATPPVESPTQWNPGILGTLQEDRTHRCSRKRRCNRGRDCHMKASAGGTALPGIAGILRGGPAAPAGLQRSLRRRASAAGRAAPRPAVEPYVEPVRRRRTPAHAALVINCGLKGFFLIFPRQRGFASACLHMAVLGTAVLPLPERSGFDLPKDVLEHAPPGMTTARPAPAKPRPPGMLGALGGGGRSGGAGQAPQAPVVAVRRRHGGRRPRRAPRRARAAGQPPLRGACPVLGEQGRTHFDSPKGGGSRLRVIRSGKYFE
eukprot:gene17627-biopygen12899